MTQSAQAGSPKRALIVHTGGGLGDVLLSRPVVDAVHQGGYQVDFLARTGTASALAHHPRLSSLLTIPGKDPAGLKEVREWAQRLKAHHYDLAILLWSTSRWAWTLYLAGIPCRVGQDSRLLYSFLFTHPVKVRSEHGDEQSHWTEILLDYPRRIDLSPPGEIKVEYSVDPDHRHLADQLCQDFDFAAGGPLVGFHSGKGLPLSISRWPVDHFAALASRLQTDLDARLVLTGGPDEIDLVGEVARRLPRPALNLAGKTELGLLAAVQQKMQVYVCPDSGPMHLAAAVGTPVVGIYALDEDFPHRWAPFGVPHVIIRPPRPACPPGCQKPTCPNFRCYLKVQPEHVVDAVRQLLEASPD